VFEGFGRLAFIVAPKFWFFRFVNIFRSTLSLATSAPLAKMSEDVPTVEQHMDGSDNDLVGTPLMTWSLMILNGQDEPPS
jgi:hypothetical protein